MGISLGNGLLGSTGLSSGSGLSRGSGLSFGGFSISPAFTANFLLGSLPSGITATYPNNITGLGGLVADSTGYLTYKPNNLLLNSATLSTQSVTTITGVNYIVAFYGTGSITLSGAATGTITGTGAGVQVYSKVTATTTTLTLTVSGSVTSATCSAVTYETTPRSGDQVVTTSSVYYGPAFDYSVTSVGTPLGLRLWEARTNLLTYSNTFSNAAWASTIVTWTANSGTSPDGSNNAWLLAASSSPNNAYSINSTASTTGVMSVYAKIGTARYLIVDRGVYTSNDYAVFDLQTGTITQSPTYAGSSASIVSAGNGWYRCILNSAQAATINVVTVSGASTGTTTPANGNILVYGAQVEVATFAGPYIPTGSASVSTAADVATLSGSALSLLQGSSGSAIVELTPANASNGRRILRESSTTTAPLLLGTGAVLGTYNGTTELDTSSALVVGTKTRAGVAWSAAGRSASLGGGTVATDANSFGTISGAAFSAASNFVSGWYSTLAEYNQRLPDAQLQARTTVGAAF